MDKTLSSDLVYLQKDGAIARLILNRPEKRNAMTYAMWRAVPGCVADAVGDPAVKLLIVQGVDRKAFAAGADIGEFEELFATRQGSADYSDAVRGAEQALGNCPKPAIAMIHGDCFGGGVELAIACDMRFASSESRFGVPPAKLGVVYSLTSTRRLVELTGPGKTRDLLFSGRAVRADEALSMGLVERLHAPDALEAETMAYAEVLLGNSQFSIRAGKKIVSEILKGATTEDDEIRALRVDGFYGEDTREGIRAYKEKRKPDFPWKG